MSQGCHIYRLNPLGDFFHEPLGRGGGAADAHFPDVGGQGLADVVGVGDEESPWVGFPAFLEKHFPVRAFLPGHEVDPVVAGGEFLQVWQAVGHLPADRVVVFERDAVGDPLPDLGDDGLEAVQRFGGLREEVDGAVEIQPVQVFRFLDDDGRAVGLAH